MPGARTFAALLLSALLAGCASYPPNAPTTAIDPAGGYRFDNLASKPDSDRLFVIVTLSGGGTRAAALSYGVLDALNNTTIKVGANDPPRSLLDEVDVISSVSGGSFTAAYYGLFRERLFADTDGFRDRFLYRDIEADLAALLLNPLNWLRLASPTYGRIDLASEFYNREIFEERTYADLQQTGRPLIMVNATDMSAGAPFRFLQSQFDYLCSDLSPFKVGRAVAASSDFPIAFTPLQINNYANRCPMQKPIWIVQAEKDRDFAINPRRNARARTAWSYRDHENREFIHLLDGGVADNIGLRGPLAAISSADPALSLQRKINMGEIDRLVVIVVDAKTSPTVHYDRSPDPPGLITVLNTIATLPLDNYSFDTVDLLKQSFAQLRRERAHLWPGQTVGLRPCPPAPSPPPPDGGLKPLDLYAIYVGFDQIADGETVQGHDRDWYLNLDTSFVLKQPVVDTLSAAGADLLQQSTDFQALKRCIGG